MLQVIPTFFVECSEKILFISANTYKKNIVCNDYCVAFHNDKTCSVSFCKFHIILLGIVHELLKKLDTFCFTYQHVDCLHRFFKYRFSGKWIAKSGQVFDNLQRAVDFIHRNKRVERMPSIAKNSKFKTHLFSSFQKTKERRLVDQCLPKEFRKVEKTKFQLELTKTVDCFLVGYDNYDSNLVSFKKSFYQTKIFVTVNKSAQTIPNAS